MKDRVRSSTLRAAARLSRRVPVPVVERALRRVYSPERPRPCVEDIVPIGDDLVFRASTSSFLEWRVFFLGTYEPDVSRLLPMLLRPGQAAVDVGAHAGIHTLRLARLAAPGPVLAFEPNPAVFDRLERNVALNHLTNVHLHRVALSDTTGRARLYVPDPSTETNEGTASLSAATADASTVPVAVATTTLDTVVDAASLPSVDVIKIDVEGFEAAVLAGARRVLERDHPSLIFEFSATLWARAGFDLSRLELELLDLGYPEPPRSITPRGLVRTETGLPRFKNLVVVAPRLQGKLLHASEESEE